MASDAEPESLIVELKGEFVPKSGASRVRLVREVVAIANTSGGELVLGVREDGSRPGLPHSSVALLDAARVADLVDSYVSPAHVELHCRTEGADDSGCSVVVVVVERHPDPPLVFCREGNYQGGKGQQSEFRRGDVYVRRSTKAERASHKDYEAWTAAAVERERERWRSRVTLLRDMPPEAEFRVSSGGEERDEPAFALARAVESWSRDPSKLLDGRELAHMLLAANTLVLDDEAKALLVQSSLRRKPTLWHWLTLFSPEPGWVKEMLVQAMDGSDRDKSDAGRAIVEVAALLLDSKEYGGVLKHLGESSYKHFREAAEAGKPRAAELKRLRATRASAYKGEDLQKASDESLRDAARRVAGEIVSSNSIGLRIHLGRIGLELFARSAHGDLLR